MLKPNIVRYRVTGSFGCVSEGSEIDVVLIIKDSDFGVLYHPKDGSGCGSIEIGKLGDDGIWISAVEEVYVNVSNKTFESDLFGKNFKYQMNEKKKQKEKHVESLQDKVNRLEKEIEELRGLLIEHYNRYIHHLKSM